MDSRRPSDKRGKRGEPNKGRSKQKLALRWDYLCSAKFLLLEKVDRLLI
jgi:hypothetical protein